MTKTQAIKQIISLMSEYKITTNDILQHCIKSLGL